MIWDVWMVMQKEDGIESFDIVLYDAVSCEEKESNA